MKTEQKLQTETRINKNATEPVDEVELEILAAVVHERVALVVVALLLLPVSGNVFASVVLGPRLVVREDLICGADLHKFLCSTGGVLMISWVG